MRQSKKCRSSAFRNYSTARIFAPSSRPAGTNSPKGSRAVLRSRPCKSSLRNTRWFLVVPVYEVEMTGVYFNTAAVIDADGRYLGKYRKHHIPHWPSWLFGKNFISRQETPATPSSRRRYAASACTSVTTATSPKVRASSASTRGNCLQPLCHGRRSLRTSLGTLSSPLTR